MCLSLSGCQSPAVVPARRGCPDHPRPCAGNRTRMHRSTARRTTLPCSGLALLRHCPRIARLTAPIVASLRRCMIGCYGEGMTEALPITREAIAATEAAIRPYVRRTPLLQADLADFGLAPGPLTFKLEMLQRSGSFKARGAFANLLLRPVPDAGVVAASGGNHGAAVAYAAQRLAVPATIFVRSEEH